MEGLGAGVAVEQLALLAAYNAHLVDGILVKRREREKVR
mgnify:CR=1 FL=1